jgi:hypothetical protein
MLNVDPERVIRPPYRLETLRRFKEGRDHDDHKSPAECLADIPVDAQMDDGIALGCWNGERFVSWEKWLAGVD